MEFVAALDQDQAVARLGKLKACPTSGPTILYYYPS
jgi:hypothetical protein